MAMTLRLTDEQHAKLAEAAERAGMSMQAFVIHAIEERIDRTARRDEVQTVARQIQTHHRGLLDRLAQ